MLRCALFVIIAWAVSYATAGPQIKSVKGGGGGYFPYNATGNLVRFFGNNTDQHQTSGHYNTTLPLSFERGVCYTEVPTASLVKNSGHIPAGNGSSPELSRIRICCRGYIRNIHSFLICDPVCTEECVNALCTAPETCTCYPDHVKNLAGVCVPTCPIGCQNGVCSGGECLCKDGYTLDIDSKYCYPVCAEQCSGRGNCTAPNTCECSKGFESIDGSCRAHCDHCNNGDCISPNNCRCHQGYASNQLGECTPLCPQGCGPNGHCSAPNVCSCGEGFDFDQATRQCRPKCARPCNNGDCVAPNDCRCHRGYTKNEQGECVPVCTQNCGSNGRCIAPNVCSCGEGYELDQISHECRPRCSGPCHNGECAAPNECKCHHGYTKNEYGECVPDCPQGCGLQGQCVAPNICACAPGSQMDPITHQCQGSSTGCTGQCINGVCNGNVCTCNTGYILDTSDPSGTRCIPNCPGGCTNGVCSAPNFCICNMGFVKDRSVKGRQTCVRRARRSINPDTEDLKKPLNVADLLIFELPEDY